MKKFASVLVVGTFVLLMGTFSGCSSAEHAPEEGEATAAVEPAANNEAFDALANSDVSANPDAGAVMDTSTPSSFVADSSLSASEPATSPVNLGASSAGRSH